MPGFLELVVIAFVAIVVFGPDKLPDLAKQAGQLIRKGRNLANNARDELRTELGPAYSDLELRDLDPQRRPGRDTVLRPCRSRVGPAGRVHLDRARPRAARDRQRVGLPRFPERRIHAVDPGVTVVAALARFDDLWKALIPAEQARIVQLLVARITVSEAGLAIDLRHDGLGAIAALMAPPKKEVA